MNPQFRENHSDEPFQLFVAISSEDDAGIRRQLVKLIEECDSQYGKPIQGISCHAGSTVEIITPKWNGENYL